MADFKNSFRIPKRHTLKHYMQRFGELYGEPKESLDVYIDEQLVKNEDNLDKAIDCFRDLMPEPLQSNKRVDAVPMTKPVSFKLPPRPKFK